MHKLKLIRGRSYCGRGVKATAKEPFVEVADKTTADYLVKSKRFEFVAAPVSDEDDPTNVDPPSNTPPGLGDAPSDQWTVPMLRAYATENDIDLTGLTVKADILAKIYETIAEGMKPDFNEE